MDRLLGALTAPLLPAWALAILLHPRWRRDRAERLGWRTPLAQPGSVWVHASSVGEVGAAWALIEQLPDPIVFTADTDTGAARARALAAARPGVAAGCKPVDHPLTLAPLWAEARPRLVVFVEGTFWPSLAWRARREGVPVVRVSAKLGRRTARFGPLLAPWWAPVDAVWARDAAAAEALARVHRCPVLVGGDLKAAASAPAPLLSWPRPFAVGASTRDGDELRLLSALDRVAPELGCVLAPREPSRFDAVARALDGRRWARRTALAGGVVPPGVDVVLLDTLGELPGALVGASVAFVGGTFDPAIGGHSPWEAAVAGVPVVAGPHGSSQGDAFDRVGATRGPDLAVSLARALAGPAPALPVRPSLGVEVAAWRGAPAPERCPRPLARPLACLFGAFASARNQLYDRGWLRVEAVGVPVISVGSTNARSPGRTSTVRAVALALAARGHRVGIANRGYR
ncbi:MAG: tetraacyldisaccharide 4'-kinase, partial [Myxococcota bacterium]